jgi:hypothetical protein
MNEEKVRAMAGNIARLFELHDQQQKTYVELLGLCLGELRKSKRFIDMSKDERAHRKQLIEVLETLTGDNK